MNLKNTKLYHLTVMMLFLLPFAVSTSVSAETPEPVMQLQPSTLQASNAGAVVRDARSRRVGPELTALHQLYVSHKATRSAQPFKSGVPSIQVKNEMVLIDTAADGDPAELVAALKSLGAIDIAVFKRVVSARLPVAEIPKLANIQSLRFSRPVRARTRVGLTTSQGDPSMKTDDARSAFGVDGSGITVGVLTDSFDTGPGAYATDITSSDLPVGIEVVSELAGGSDEGRAMAQLIYDVAPGANFSFHTATSGLANFALGIQELAGCPPGSELGCTAATDPAEVIVDDVGYPTQPFFQDGIVAQAVDVVVAAGVSYFSAAGNDARNSWEDGPFNSSGISPVGYGRGDAHDFDPGAGVDIYQAVVFPAGTTTVSFQWDQPFFSVSGAPGSANDMDICVYLTPGGALIGCAATNNLGADPLEVFSFTFGAPITLHFAIVKFIASGGPDPGFMKYIALKSGFSVTDPYGTPMASASYGHPNSMGAVGVGAARYFDTPDFGTDPAIIEPFSSAGGTRILFDTSGSALPMPEIRMRPQIVAPDGTNTTFFGADDTPPGFCCEGDSFPNFFGTSAAASHAAAVAALMLEAFPGLTPSGIQNVMTSGAHDMGPAGFDFDSGYGLIDGNTAVASVDTSTSCDGVADLILTGTPSSGPGTFSAMTSISYQGGNFQGFDAYAPRHAFGPGTSIGNSTSFSSCP